MAARRHGVRIGPEFGQIEFAPLPVETYAVMAYVANRYGDGSADVVVTNVSRKRTKLLRDYGFSRVGRTRRFVRAPSPRDGPGDPVWYWARQLIHWMARVPWQREEGEVPGP